MRSGPLFFVGLFSVMVLSFVGIVLGSSKQLGGLTPFYDDGESKSFPERSSGIAARGQLVYRDLGCVVCHTQQVRRPGFGSDQARGWGERQSVARDYIYQADTQLGSMRIGPDLTNLAGRKSSAPLDADELYQLLYSGLVPLSKSPTHPRYRFIFDEVKITGEVPAKALKFASKSGSQAGGAVVPTERAQALVAYLLSLKTVYDYPESRPVPAVTAKQEGAHK